MHNKQKAFFNWSSGKDSAFALYKAMQAAHYEIVSLFTTVDARRGAVAMHRTPLGLLQAQAESIGLPLTVLEVDFDAPETYAAQMQAAMDGFMAQGVTVSLFGDLFLYDLREKREANCVACGLTAAFPIWQTPQETMINEFLDTGFRAVVTCADDRLGADFVGREIDRDLLAALPDGVDPRGENGEYHSFVFDGPIFHHPVVFTRGELYCVDYAGIENPNEKRRFWYLDLAEKGLAKST